MKSLFLVLFSILPFIGVAQQERYVLTDLNLPPEYNYNNAPTRSFVTVAAAANGWQLSATRKSFVRYSIRIVSTMTVTGGSEGAVLLEMCPTNSAVAADWQELGRLECGQTGALIIGVNIVQKICAQLTTNIPAGYYIRLRTINVSTVGGTPTYAIVSGQEVLL